jgi:hypothetical protein
MIEYALFPAARHPVVSACRPRFDVVFFHLPATSVPQRLVIPVLGFIFLPVTTIVYAWELNSGMPAGINLLWLLIAVVIDLGGLGGSAHRQSRR